MEGKQKTSNRIGYVYEDSGLTKIFFYENEESKEIQEMSKLYGVIDTDAQQDLINCIESNKINIVEYTRFLFTPGVLYQYLSWDWQNISRWQVYEDYVKIMIKGVVYEIDGQKGQLLKNFMFLRSVYSENLVDLAIKTFIVPNN